MSIPRQDGDVAAISAVIRDRFAVTVWSEPDYDPPVLVWADGPGPHQVAHYLLKQHAATLIAERADVSTVLVHGHTWRLARQLRSRTALLAAITAHREGFDVTEAVRNRTGEPGSDRLVQYCFTLLNTDYPPGGSSPQRPADDFLLTLLTSVFTTPRIPLHKGPALACLLSAFAELARRIELVEWADRLESSGMSGGQFDVCAQLVIDGADADSAVEAAVLLHPGDDAPATGEPWNPEIGRAVDDPRLCAVHPDMSGRTPTA